MTITRVRRRDGPENRREPWQLLRSPDTIRGRTAIWPVTRRVVDPSVCSGGVLQTSALERDVPSSVNRDDGRDRPTRKRQPHVRHEDYESAAPPAHADSGRRRARRKPVCEPGKSTPRRLGGTAKTEAWSRSPPAAERPAFRVFPTVRAGGTPVCLAPVANIAVKYEGLRAAAQ